MRKHPFLIFTFLLVVAGAAMLWVATGGLAGLRATPVAPLSQAELEGLLLVVEDLPPGWRQDEAVEDEEAPGETREYLGQELPERVQRSARARFSGGDLGPFLLYTVEAYGAGEAALTFAEQAEVIRAARPYSVTLASGDVMMMEMWPLTFAELGTQSVAVRSVTSEAPMFGTVYSDSVVVLVEEAEVIVRLTGIALGGEAMNQEQMEALVRTGVERVSGGR